MRGFTYGPAYEHALSTLRAQQRLIEEADPAGVGRALRQGLAQATVMAAHILIGTLAQEADLAPLAGQLRVEPLQELGWAESGVYLSRRTLADADRLLLRRRAAAGRPLGPRLAAVQWHLPARQPERQRATAAA